MQQQENPRDSDLYVRKREIKIGTFSMTYRLPFSSIGAQRKVLFDLMDDFEFGGVQVSIGTDNPIPQVAKSDTSGRHDPEEAILRLWTRLKMQVPDYTNESCIDAQEK